MGASVTITYQKESVTAIAEEITPLLAAHFAEIGHHQEVRKFSPDWDTIGKMENLGNVFTLTARDSGVLVGYLSAIITNELHCRSILSAYVDIVYVSLSARANVKIFINLLKFSEVALISRGVSTIYHHVKPAKDFGKVLKRMGYDMTETIYCRAIA